MEPHGELFQIQIYSSDTRKWKITGESFTADSFSFFKHGVYWNGAIHWAPSCLDPLYFNIKDEQLRTLPSPTNVASSGGYYDGALPKYFGESRGHLHLVETSNRENRLHLNVYEMLSDHSGWFVKYQVELEKLPGDFPEMIRSYQLPLSPHYFEFDVFDVVRGEKEEDTFMVLRIPGKIIRYNVHGKSFQQISNLPNYYYEAHANVHRYTETLTSF